jgi:TonB family protein
VLFFLAVRYAPQPDFSQFEPAKPLKDIVWLNVPGPGGGGGGGNRRPEPPRKAELPGRQPISVPVQEPPKPTPKVEQPPIESLTIPAMNSAAAQQALIGAIDSSLTGPPDSLGSGRGGGVGPGQGSGYGPGFGGGIGGGAYRPGAGITLPRVLKEVKPAYTADAMRAKVQGSVWLECIVLPDGTVGDVRVTRSLDPIFGLDQEAVKAAKAWRFVPGTRLGQAVPVIVTIELTFTLR